VEVGLGGWGDWCFCGGGGVWRFFVGGGFWVLLCIPPWKTPGHTRRGKEKGDTQILGRWGGKKKKESPPDAVGGGLSLKLSSTTGRGAPGGLARFRKESQIPPTFPLDMFPVTGPCIEGVDQLVKGGSTGGGKGKDGQKKEKKEALNAGGGKQVIYHLTKLLSTKEGKGEPLRGRGRSPL